jgi:hypothetical protein
MYVIIKHVKTNKGKTLPVIMIDSSSEVLEFDVKEEADNFADIMNTNTDSGHLYEVKKI